MGGSALAWDEKLVGEVTYLLRAIYHSCVFHRLDQGAHIALALEDLYARVAEGEMALSEALLDLTRACVAQLNITIESVCAGQVSDTNTLADLLDQAERILHIHTGGCLSQVTQSALDLLDLSPEFREVMTSENLLEVSRVLQTGKTFYTVLADLNELIRRRKPQLYYDNCYTSLLIENSSSSPGCGQYFRPCSGKADSRL